MLGLFGIVFAYYLIYISHHIFYLYVAFGIIGISMGITVKFKYNILLVYGTITKLLQIFS